MIVPETRKCDNIDNNNDINIFLISDVKITAIAVHIMQYPALQKVHILSMEIYKFHLKSGRRSFKHDVYTNV